MSKELYSQVVGPLNKGLNQQADSFVLPGFAKNLENANCDLVEGLKKRLGSVPLKEIDTLTKYDGHGTPGNNLSGTIKWDEAWYFIYNRSSDERFLLIIGDDSSTVVKTVSHTDGSAVLEITSGGLTDLFEGAGVNGSNIPTGSTIVNIDTANSKITISKKCTTTDAGVALTVQAPKTFVSGVANLEPISDVLPEVVPIQQVFANITTANLEYFRGSGKARDRFRATSFQDYVFVTNVQKVTEFDSSEALERYNVTEISNEYRPTMGIVVVDIADYSCKYDVVVKFDNGTEIDGTYTTPTLASGTAISTGNITNELQTNLLADSNASGNITVNALGGGFLKINVVATGRYISSFTVSDARGNTLMTSFTNQVTSASQLPKNGWHGYSVLLAPDGSTDKSSYYLKFNAESSNTNGTFDRGSWEEQGAWGTKGKIDKATMPHSFVYFKDDDGIATFTVKPFDGTT